MRTSPDRAATALAGSVLAAPRQPEARARARATPQRPFFALLSAALLAALAFRLFLLSRYYVTPDADQTILGLMARHIQAGERPVFYWGQPYTGAAEAYLTAVLFAAFGQSDWLLHAAPLAASLAFVAATCTLAWRLYGMGVATLCALYLAFAPILLIEWGFWAGSGYLEMMALGSAALLLALPPRGRVPHRWFRLPIAWFCLGLALWIQPSAIFYALAVLAVLAGRILAVLRSPRLWAAGLALASLSLVACALGAAPLLIYNLQHRGETLTFLTTRDTAHSLGIATVGARALLWTGPILLGLIPPTTDRLYLYRFLSGHLALYGLALGLVLLLLMRGALLWRPLVARLRTVVLTRPAPDLGLLVLLIVMPAAFLTSSWGAELWSSSQPRYLLPLYAALPPIVRGCLPARPRRLHWALAALAALSLVAADTWVNTATFAREDLRPLAHLLEARGVAAVYGDYWTVYPLAFESEERIVAVPVKDDLSRGYTRYSPYLRRAAESEHYAWVVASGSARERAVVRCLGRRHSRYRRLIWHDQTIYDAITHGAFPWWTGGRCTLTPP